MSNPIIVIIGDSTAAALGANANALSDWIKPNCVSIATVGHRIDQVQAVWEASAYYGNPNVVAVIVCAVLNDLAAKASIATIRTRKAALIASIRAGTPTGTPILWNGPNCAKARWTDLSFSAPEIATAQADWQTFLDELVDDAVNNFYAIKGHVAYSNDGSGNFVAKFNYADDHIHGNDGYRPIQAHFNVVKLVQLRICASVAYGRLGFGTLGDAQTRRDSLDALIGNPRNGTTSVGALVAGGGGKILIDLRSRGFFQSTEHLTDAELRAMTIGP